MATKGAIIGDILGSPYEFYKPEGFDYKNIPIYDKTKCTFTDDTVMTLAIKDAIINEKPINLSMINLGRKYSDAGYGEGFYNWLFSDDFAPYGSWGNGSAMRVSFIGEFYDDYELMQLVAKKSAELSHNHPEGIKGAVVTATCVWMARFGKTKQEIYNYVLVEYPKKDYKYSIANSLKKLRRKYKWSVLCQDSVPVALRCFYESEDYESFIRNVFSLPCDVDTLCAIGGAVAEEYYKGFGNINADQILEEKLPNDLLSIAKRDFTPIVFK